MIIKQIIIHIKLDHPVFLLDTRSKSIFSEYPLKFDPIYFNWMYLHEPNNYVLWMQIIITIIPRTNSNLTVPHNCTSNYSKKENFTQLPHPYKNSIR